MRGLKHGLHLPILHLLVAPLAGAWNDGAKGYWLDKSVFLDSKLLDLKDK